MRTLDPTHCTRGHVTVACVYWQSGRPAVFAVDTCGLHKLSWHVRQCAGQGLWDRSYCRPTQDQAATLAWRISESVLAAGTSDCVNAARHSGQTAAAQQFHHFSQGSAHFSNILLCVRASVLRWPSITEWEMYITAQGWRLRNDLYCVEWDVKLYYTIPYHLHIHFISALQYNFLLYFTLPYLILHRLTLPLRSTVI